jgi:hypothetical protein
MEEYIVELIINLIGIGLLRYSFHKMCKDEKYFWVPALIYGGYLLIGFIYRYEDKEWALEFLGFHIGGIATAGFLLRSYIKLRDLAFILNGTEKQFNVGWDNANKAVSITTGQAYTGKAAEFAKEHYVKTFLTESPIYVDGVKADFTVYNIGGNNYFKLRDLAKYFDFYLHAAADELTIDATKKYQ